jgi:hypothetical protein
MEADPIQETFTSILSLISKNGDITGSLTNLPNPREKFLVQLGANFIHIKPNRNLNATVSGSSTLPTISLPFRVIKQLNNNLFQLESGDWLLVPESPLLFSLAKRAELDQ